MANVSSRRALCMRWIYPQCSAHFLFSCRMLGLICGFWLWILRMLVVDLACNVARIVWSPSISSYFLAVFETFKLLLVLVACEYHRWGRLKCVTGTMMAS